MANAGVALGSVTALFGWFTWLLFFSTLPLGIVLLIPPALAITFGIITLNEAGDAKEIAKGYLAIRLVATRPFIGWFAFLFILKLRSKP